MTNNSITLHQLTPDSPNLSQLIFELGIIFYDSFQSNPLTPAMFLNTTRQDQIMFTYNRLQSDLLDINKRVYIAKHHQMIVGYAVYEYMIPGQVEDQNKKKLEWPDGCDMELVNQLFSRMEEAAQQIQVKHYREFSRLVSTSFRRLHRANRKNAQLDLHILAISPQHQRTGAGAALLNQVITESEQKQVALHLDATAGTCFDSFLT